MFEREACYVACRSMVSQPQMKCRRALQALVNIAVEELCETASALIAPVCMGVARPTAPFALATSTADVLQVEFDIAELCCMVFSS